MAKTLTVYLAADLKKFQSGMNQAENRVTGFSGTLKNTLGPALIGAGVAAGAFATKLAVDGVKSAIEDEAAVAKLATTLRNLGFDDALDPLEAWIAELELASGIVDNELRAAFERLVRSTGDVEEAQKALTISVDISASKGKDLEAVADSLGKAYDGQVTSLQRLGLGISNTTILSRDMEAVTSELQQLFAGQSTAAAKTYEGQLNRLNVSVENLKEEFGKGLLEALGDTNGKTEELMDTMKDLGPLLEGLGGHIGTTASDILFLAGQVTNLTGELGKLLPSLEANTGAADDFYQGLNLFSSPLSFFTAGVKTLQETLGASGREFRGMTSATVAAAKAAGAAVPKIDAIGDEAEDSGTQASTAARKFLTLGAAMAAVGGEAFNWRREVSGATDEARDLATELDNQVIDSRYEEWLQGLEDAMDGVGGSTGSTTAKVDEQIKAQNKLAKAYEDTSMSLNQTQSDLQAHISELDNATKAVQDYASSIQDDLLAGISLEAAFKGQFTKEGEATGVSLIEGFNRQIDQAEWFGNVLNAIKAKGADQTLVEEIASLGPGIGGALGQQMLDDGLVPTLSEKWTSVQETTAGLADQLVPEFLRAGVSSGIEAVNGLATQLGQETKRLGKIGKKMAQPVGAAFRAQIAQDVAKAVRAVEAAATAARAEAVASAEAQQAALTEQAVAQALGRLVSNADARNGRNVSPVLS